MIKEHFELEWHMEWIVEYSPHVSVNQIELKGSSSNRFAHFYTGNRDLVSKRIKLLNTKDNCLNLLLDKSEFQISGFIEFQDSVNMFICFEQAGVVLEVNNER